LVVSVARIPVRVRLFLAVWLITGLHFATNVVREHYPAFALVAHGDLRCDEWAGLSPDLFRHTDGHWYANNQVGASLVAAPLLFAFEPLLRRLEETGKRQAADHAGRATFASDYPMRAKFMAAVYARGLHLRFGAAAAATAIFVMAPCAGLLALLMHALLLRRGVAEPRATTLALLSVFATPVLFRSAILNHNQLEALAAFAAFFVLQRGTRRSSRFGAGLLAGATLLFDWSGVVVVGVLAFVLVAGGARGSGRAGAAKITDALRDLLAFAGGVAVPLTLLFATQSWSFGDPFLPAQRWMAATALSGAGWYGLGPPSFDLLLRSLVDASFGLFAFAPLLLLACVPAPAAILTRRERLFVLVLTPAFLLFISMNRYFELQWNTGFRSLAPLVPFLFLLACERLARLSSRALLLIAAPCVVHAWVVALARATPPVEPYGFADSTLARSWRALFDHGVQLPWVTVWRQTQPGGGPAWAGFASTALIAALLLLLVVLWRWRRPTVARIVPTQGVAP
jgi:hypothetical protein